jgi:DNA-binding NtrC family response regulator
MPVSCAAIPPSLLEGELFGYCKGAFTGAEQDHEGLFIQAGAGTLFLDDIDDLTPHAQAALLRVLQEREVTPLGATAPIPVHATVLAASKIDLADAIRDGHFREDLYHRLAVVPLRLPPLRERRSDLPALLADFFSRLDPEGRFTVSPDTLDRLARYDWPGNTRELENSATRAIALAGRMRSLRQEHFLPGGASITSGIRPENILPLREQIRLAERLAIRESLMATDGLRGAAANLLGISRKVFWAKAKELGLEDPKEDATRGDA